MCACTEPVRTGIGAVCVEYGRPKWPNKMLNNTCRIMFCFLFLAPDARTTRYEEAFFPLVFQHEQASLVCARTEPVRTGIGAVCVEYGRPKWPNTMLNNTYPGTE